MEPDDRTPVPRPDEILDAFCRLADDDCGPKWRHDVYDRPYMQAELWQEYPEKDRPKTAIPEITGCVFLTAPDEAGLVDALVKWTSEKKQLGSKWPTNRLGTCCSPEELAIKLSALGYM